MHDEAVAEATGKAHVPFRDEPQYEDSCEKDDSGMWWILA